MSIYPPGIKRGNRQSPVGSRCFIQVKHRAEPHGLWAVGMSHDNLPTVLPSADTLSDTALTLAPKVLRHVQNMKTWNETRVVLENDRSPSHHGFQYSAMVIHEFLNDLKWSPKYGYGSKHVKTLLPKSPIYCWCRCSSLPEMLSEMG